MTAIRIRISGRRRRRQRIRAKIFGLASRPRLSVFRSNRFLSVQLIDDQKGQTLAAASTANFRKESVPTAASPAERLGQEIGRRAAARKIKKVVFDRGGYRYAGQIKILAEAARKAGLDF